MSTATSQVSPYVLDARQKIKESAEFIRSRSTTSPKVGIILGSGLGALADQVTGATHLPYGEIPHFPVSTAPGHKGNLVVGGCDAEPIEGAGSDGGEPVGARTAAGARGLAP